MCSFQISAFGLKINDCPLALKVILFMVLQVASVTFDLLLLLVLGSYLIVLFSFLVITTKVSIYIKC